MLNFTKVLIFALNAHNDLQNRFASYMKPLLLQRATIQFAFDTDTALKALSAKDYRAVIIIDTGIMKAENWLVVKLLVQFVKDRDGTVVFSCLQTTYAEGVYSHPDVDGNACNKMVSSSFATVPPADLALFFKKHWGLSWQAGICQIANGVLMDDAPQKLARYDKVGRLWNVPALWMRGVQATDKIYFSPDAVLADQSPVVFTKLGKGGHVGWNGDMEGGEVGSWATLALLGMATWPVLFKGAKEDEIPDLVEAVIYNPPPSCTPAI